MWRLTWFKWGEDMLICCSFDHSLTTRPLRDRSNDVLVYFYQFAKNETPGTQSVAALQYYNYNTNITILLAVARYNTITLIPLLLAVARLLSMMHVYRT